MDNFPPHISSIAVRNAVEEALVEDLGRAGDITSNATIPADAKATCVLATRQDGVLCGLEFARTAFAAIDADVSFSAKKTDCDALACTDIIAKIEGNARAILAAERVALNFLMRMSGIASYTALFARQIEHTAAQVCCTRKMVPGHRAFDKYAVKCGGGSNHRFGLDDAILIKDNHIAVAGGVKTAIERARSFAGHLVKVEVEVDTINQLEQALEAAPDVVLLDNMSNAQLEQAVALNQKHNAGDIKLEASGNVNIDTVRAIAETGVDYISTSKITMAAPTLDIGLDIAVR